MVNIIIPMAAILQKLQKLKRVYFSYNLHSYLLRSYDYHSIFANDNKILKVTLSYRSISNVTANISRVVFQQFDLPVTKLQKRT